VTSSVAISPPEASGPVVAERVRLSAMDGYELGGWWCPPPGGAPVAVGFICGGGGVPARSYRRFAEHMAARGIGFLAFDYRGVGLSRRGRLRGLPARAEDWAELDIAGAIAYLAARHPTVPVVAVAHSIGAFLFGGARNASQVSAACFVAPHTGYFADYAPLYRLPMTLAWHGVMPVLVRVMGYFPGKRLGLGEDLPAGIASQWAARRTPDFRPAGTKAEVVRARAMIERSAAVRCPLLCVLFADDAFATQRGARRLLSLYARAPHDIVAIAPADLGLGRIGHLGFLRARAAPVWDRIADHLSNRPGSETIADR
jgi:predicted alpha/beta hydrolase